MLFTLFTIGIIIFEQAREKSYKTQALEEKLEAYTDIIQAKISEDKDSIVPEITSLQTILPKELRITLISNNGIVIYDNSINDYAHLSNHKNRPEIIGANNIGKVLTFDYRNLTNMNTYILPKNLIIFLSVWHCLTILNCNNF